jgi:hypothetical protein
MSRRTEQYSDSGRLLRTIDSRDIEQVDGIWIARRVTATTEKSQHSSTFEFTEVDYTTPVEDDLFTERSLARGVRRD